MSEARSCWAVVLFIWTLDAQVHALVLLNPARCILLYVPIATVPPLPLWLPSFSYLLLPQIHFPGRMIWIIVFYWLKRGEFIVSRWNRGLSWLWMLEKRKICLSYSLPCQQGMCWCMPLKTQDKSSANRSAAAAIVISIHLSITTQPKWLGILIGRDTSLEQNGMARTRQFGARINVRPVTVRQVWWPYQIFPKKSPANSEVLVEALLPSLQK